MLKPSLIAMAALFAIALLSSAGTALAASDRIIVEPQRIIVEPS